MKIKEKIKKVKTMPSEISERPVERLYWAFQISEGSGKNST
jgi:hypothetical protein